MDAGEQAALSLALELHADAILIDEENGREVARLFGLTGIGLLGVLLRAKDAGLIEVIAPILSLLQEQAGIWMSESLRQQVLQMAGETS